MFINLIDVKINNKYDYRAADAPTIAEDEDAGYLTGQTWLDLETGLSYILLDQTDGTWGAIELSEDSVILLNGDRIFLSLLNELNNKFFVVRNGNYNDLDCGLPSYTNFTRSMAYKLLHTESLYSSWAFVATTKTITAAGLYGDMSAFAAGDVICIESRKNTGFFTIASKGADYITVNETLKDDTAFAMIYLVIIPNDLLLLVGRVVWYDIYVTPNNSTGIQSESIGTYSYTLQDIAAGGYPPDIKKGIEHYALTNIGGISYYVD